ncbi:MAG: hypothetical protein ACOC1K_05460 [Nanoarchaeota archaeon]
MMVYTTQIGYKDLLFETFKFKKDKSNYPWNNSKEEEKYFDDLFENNKKEEYKRIIREQITESIHICVSYNSLLLTFGKVGLVFLLFVSSLLTLFSTTFSLFVVGGAVVVAIAFLISYFLTNKTYDYYIGLQGHSDLIDFVFENK